MVASKTEKEEEKRATKINNEARNRATRFFFQLETKIQLEK